MTMSEPPGSAASSLIEADGGQHDASSVTGQPVRSHYIQQLALRREAAEIGRLIGYGLTLGWILTFVFGFLFFCVRSRFDWLWCGLMWLGIAHLVAAVVLPQVLAWPERVWMTIARWQGHVVMTVLLTTVYFLLLWPAGQFSRRYKRGFVQWSDQPPETATAWQPIDLAGEESPAIASARSRSLPLLLAGVIGFFFRRGNYILLPIIILLIVLGLVLFIVQNSVLAPFIYPLF
jgi:hypothetical protein